MAPSKDKSAIDLFRYDDYRKFLKDWYLEAKSSRASFSFRTFSKRAGFKSTNIFKLVMDGDRNLTEESIPNFVKGLKLNKQEQEFFRNLVLFNQAKNHEQKNFYYQKLLQSRKFKKLKPIDKAHYEYCSAWYHAVIRELILSKDCDGSAEWLVKRIQPTLTITQVEKSIELLENLGFIEKTNNGRWKQATPLVSTGPEVTSLILMNYHQNLLDLSKEKLNDIPADERDISALTLGIAKERLPQLKEKIQSFRQEILKFVSLDTQPDNVVQLNIQMYPMTRLEEDQES